MTGLSDSVDGALLRNTSPPTMSKPTTPTFSQVIDSDHTKINVLAARLRRATDQHSLVKIRNEIIWRLVRHDYSEDIIMRPAFARYLGPEGEAMAQHDRDDHGDVKKTLIPMLESDRVDVDQKESLIRMFDELKEHMKVESGKQIPELERVLSRAASENLGRRYMETQMVWPGARNRRGEIMFGGGIKEYCSISRGRFEDLVNEVDPLENEEEEVVVKEAQEWRKSIEKL